MDESTKRTKTVWSYILLYPLALILIFEEWGWEPLAKQIEKLRALSLWRKIEDGITHLLPWEVMIILAVPFCLLIPVKILGLYLVNKGKFILGASIIVGAKIFGTAFFARLFKLTQPILLKIKWFSVYYPKWKNWKDNLLEQVRQINRKD